MLFLMTAAVGGQSALRCSSVNEVGIDYDISPQNITEEHKHKTQPPFRRHTTAVFIFFWRGI